MYYIRLSIIVLICSLSISLFPEDYITKGPAPGEIYFTAPFEGGYDLGLYHSWDYGQSPILVDSSGLIGYITADADSGGIYHAAEGGGLYYSNNYGQNFMPHSGGETSSISSGINPGEIYKLALGIRRSEDYGVNFTLMGTSPGGQINIGSMSGELYALYETQGDLFFSSDSGQNFILVNDSIPPQIPFIWRLRHGACSGELFLLNSNSQELFYSSDTGRTLNFKYQFNLNPSSEWVLDLVGSQVVGELFILAYKYFFSGGGGEFYIFHSIDYGVTWSSYHHLTAINDKTPNPIKTFYLSQNYPNPFNGQTLIEFYLPFKENIEIAIYSITGEKVRTLRKEQLLPGRHSVRWDGTNQQGQAVSSGLYLYQLKTHRYRQSKKLLYIR